MKVDQILHPLFQTVLIITILSKTRTPGVYYTGVFSLAQSHLRSLEKTVRPSHPSEWREPVGAESGLRPEQGRLPGRQGEAAEPQDQASEAASSQLYAPFPQ